MYLLLQNKIECCPACEGRVKNPRLLACQHTYCQGCLEKMTIDYKARCLICFRTSILNDEGVNTYTFQNSFIVHMYEYYDEADTNINLMLAVKALKTELEGYDEQKCATCGRNSQRRGNGKNYNCSHCNSAKYCSTKCKENDHVKHGVKCDMMAFARSLIHAKSTLIQLREPEQQNLIDVYVLNAGSHCTQLFTFRHTYQTSLKFELTFEEFASAASLPSEDKHCSNHGSLRLDSGVVVNIILKNRNLSVQAILYCIS